MIVNCYAFVIYSLGVSVISMWILINVYGQRFTEWMLEGVETVHSEYDYVVVGGGTAGSIVAGRLSQDPSVQVLLIEAGSHPSFFLDIPIIAPLLQLTEYDWQYKTVSQDRACLGLNNKISYWPMGKILGGSSRLNYEMYVRGHPHDYDNWGDQGNIGWHYADVLPYFKRSEDQRGIYRNETDFHSVHGPVQIDDLPFTTPLASAFLGAADDLGFPVKDLNQKDATGFMKTQATMIMGKRCSADSAYLFQKRKNLKIITNSVATKILLRERYEASGVKYEYYNKKYRVKARRAVIVSAGTLGSAKLLMLSGIGPKESLQKNKIDAVIDLPVGENLQDHITTGLDLVLINRSLSLSVFDIASPLALWEYFRNGGGPLTMPGCEAIALLQTSISSPSPDIQLMALPMGVSNDRGAHMKKAMNINETLWNEYFAPLQEHQVVSIMPVLLHPKSRGNLLLSSKKPMDNLLINPKYLTHPEDLHTIYEGIKIIKKLVNTKSFKTLGAKVNNKPIPGCNHHQFDSKEYWYCYIRHLTFTSYHPVGTCSMGTNSNHRSVVNSELRVHNTNHLYVIDASVMPSLPSGNINAAVMMIAEKGADIVKRHWHSENAVTLKKELFLATMFTNISLTRVEI